MNYAGYNFKKDIQCVTGSLTFQYITNLSILKLHKHHKTSIRLNYNT